jgi:hypothetical protein
MIKNKGNYKPEFKKKSAEKKKYKKYQEDKKNVQPLEKPVVIPKKKSKYFQGDKPIETVDVLSNFSSSPKFFKFKNLLTLDLKNYFKQHLNTKNSVERKTFIKSLFQKSNRNKTFIKKAKKVFTTPNVLTKKRFVNFFQKNDLYTIFNLKQDFPYPNFLQSKSEIQRATVFRDLVNKEEAYYKTISKSPLIILLSPKPKNIYITVYTLPESANGYQILWKKSTGMLEKVEGQLSFAALVELFNKLNIFLAKEYLSFQSPIRLIIKSTKYYGTNHLIQNFVKMFQKNMSLNNIYYMYKYRKRFEFFNSYATLINDAVFNYISSIWLKFLKMIRRTKIAPENLFSIKELKTFNKFFGIEYDYLRRKYKLNHFARIKRLKSLKNKKFVKKSLINKDVIKTPLKVPYNVTQR